MKDHQISSVFIRTISREEIQNGYEQQRILRLLSKQNASGSLLFLQCWIEIGGGVIVVKKVTVWSKNRHTIYYWSMSLLDIELEDVANNNTNGEGWKGYWGEVRASNFKIISIKFLPLWEESKGKTARLLHLPDDTKWRHIHNTWRSQISPTNILTTGKNCVFFYFLWPFFSTKLLEGQLLNEGRWGRRGGGFNFDFLI